MTDPAPETPPTGTPPAPPTGAETSSSGSAAPPETPPPTPPPASEWDGKVESLPKAAQDLVKALREENAGVRARASERTKAALAALGVDVGKKDDPVEVARVAAAEAQKTTEAATKAARDAQAELIVWRGAADLKVNAQALTDSRAFERAVDKLDPTAENFEAEVRKAAETVAKTNPIYQAAPAAPGKGGAEFAGGTGEGRKQATSLDEAINAHYAREPVTPTR